MKHFFPMRKSEAATLIFLLLFAVVAFLPVWRTIEVGGMVVFGWLMASLMVISPTLTLLVFRKSDRSEKGKRVEGKSMTGSNE